MINLRKLQDDIEFWNEHNFPGKESWQPLVGAMEELGELAHAHLKQNQNIRDSDFTADKEDAIGDLVIYLVDYCSRNDLDFERCVGKTWAKVRKRNWIKFPKNGVSE